MRINRLLFCVALAVLVGFAPRASSQGFGGCIDSPENPTAVLALVGGLSGAFTILRRRR